MFTTLGRRFKEDRRGNVAIIFAAVLLPIIGMTGAAIDYKRITNARAQLLMALDGALLALGSSPKRGDTEALQFLNSYVSAQLSALDYRGAWEITSLSQDGARISAEIAGSLETTLMGLLGVELVSFDTSSTVVRDQKNVELALVLDNTGSMASNGKIAALRGAATALVNIIYEGGRADERVKISLVPFVTGVNIKAPDDFSMAWMDTLGQSTYHGINFDENITAGSGSGTGGGSGGSTGGGGGVGWWGGGWSWWWSPGSWWSGWSWYPGWWYWH